MSPWACICKCLWHENTSPQSLLKPCSMKLHTWQWFKNKQICFPYRPCGGPLSGSQWWRCSPCQRGLEWRHPCYAARVQPCSGPCWKRQRHTSPERRKQTGCVGEDGRMRSLHHEAMSRNRNWRNRKQEKMPFYCIICSSSTGYSKCVFCLYIPLLTCPDSEEQLSGYNSSI